MLLIFSTLANWQWSKLDDSPVTGYVVGGLTCVIILISLLGNSMVLIAVAKTKALQRMNTAWYVSLAVADLGKATICMPIFVALLLSPGWSLSEAMCPVYHCIQMSFEVVSILNLTAISIDRVFMITRPLTYQRTVNFTKIMICISSLWVLSFLYSFLQLLWWETTTTEGSKWTDFILMFLGMSTLDCKYKPPPVMVIVDFSIAFVVPMTVMVVAYAKIFLVVHSQMKKIKRRAAELNEDASDAGQYTQIPAITKSIDAMRASTSEERLRHPPALPSRPSFAVAQPDLAKITEVPHENCSSPAHCKECSRDRTSTEDSAKSKTDPSANNAQNLTREASDLSEIDLTQEVHQVDKALASNNANSNERTKIEISSSHQADGAKLSRSTPASQALSVDHLPSKVERRSSLKKARQDSIASTKRVSVQFQLYPEEQPGTPPKETQEIKNEQSEVSKSSNTRHRPNLVLDDETTTSEAVTTETWLSGSSITRSKLARQPSEEHTNVWASRHFSTTQDFSFSSGTRASLAESTGSGQTWNSMLQRRRKSLQRIKENKAVRMTLVVVGAFIFCWLPLEVAFIIRQFCADCVTETTWLIVTMIAYSASAINPFIYNFYSGEFRRAVKRVLCCDDNVVTPWM